MPAKQDTHTAATPKSPCTEQTRRTRLTLDPENKRANTMSPRENADHDGDKAPVGRRWHDGTTEWNPSAKLHFTDGISNRRTSQSWAAFWIHRGRL